MRLLQLSFTFALALIHCTAAAAPPPGAAALSGVKTQADLTAVIAASKDAAAKRALQTHSSAILAAAAKKPHVEFVIAALDQAPGTYTKTNTTPAALKAALGGDAPLFDTLTVVNLGSATLNIKAKREVDPFDEAFYQHLGGIPDIQMLTIIHTTAQNAWLASVAQLKGLTNLSIVNQSKLNDLGLAHLAGLTNLERFGYIGTSMTGKPFKEFTGWTKLRSSSFRGSQIDDEGLRSLCENFSTLESVSLAHAKFTDAATVHLAKLKQLKGLEVGSQKATSQSLRHLVGLPLEYFQLGEGVDSPGSLAIIQEFKSLKRLTLTNCRTYTDADLQTVADMKQLEHLELGSLPMTAERVGALKRFAHLKSMRLVPPYPKELQTSIQAALPKVAIRFEQPVARMPAPLPHQLVNELPVVLAAVLPVLLIAVSGVAMRKLNWLSEEADHSLLRVTINLLVPAFIFDKVLNNPALHRPENLVFPPLVGFTTVALGIGAGWLAMRLAGLGRNTAGRTFAFSTGLYNYGYVPLPLAISLFDRETVGVLIVHNLGTEIAFWLLGTIVFAHAANEPLWKKILNPPLAAIVVTLTLNFTGGAALVPVFVKTTAHMLGACAIPMGLVLVGAMIADHLGEFHSEQGWRVMGAACVLRLGVIPVLFLLLAKFLPCSVELKRVILLQAAMPSAAFAILAARHFGGDGPTALRVVIATSAVSFVTIPLWIRAGMKWLGL